MPEQYTSVNSLDLFNSLYEERFVFKVNNVMNLCFLHRWNRMVIGKQTLGSDLTRVASSPAGVDLNKARTL